VLRVEKKEGDESHEDGDGRAAPRTIDDERTPLLNGARG
jgi:hypothetical protein